MCAVYVDNMRAPFGRMIMCHMIADTEAELHEMADKVGVARKWYQKDHYDICLSKRAIAVKLGAREITWRQLGCMVSHRRFKGRLGNPRKAEEWQNDRIERAGLYRRLRAKYERVRRLKARSSSKT